MIGNNLQDFFENGLQTLREADSLRDDVKLLKTLLSIVISKNHTEGVVITEEELRTEPKTIRIDFKRDTLTPLTEGKYPFQEIRIQLVEATKKL